MKKWTFMVPVLLWLVGCSDPAQQASEPDSQVAVPTPVANQYVDVGAPIESAAEEECDGLDNNGNGTIDEGFTDTDGDGTADCLDTEECDGFDNDGDGIVDEGYDQDGDGYSTCATSEEVATNGIDCDDTNADIFPSATEVAADSVDNDCDGLIDETEQSLSYGDVVITEIYNNPKTIPDPDGEWFEIKNNSTNAITLNGLIISDEDGEEVHVVSSESEIVVDAGAYFVMGINSDTSTNGDYGYPVAIDYEYDTV